MKNYDLLVIGGGSGGLAAAKRAASYGAKVALFEGDRLGGTCVIRGCVPKKLMSYAAQAADTLQDAAGYGFNIQADFDFLTLANKRNAEVNRLNALHKKLLENSGVEFISHFAQFSGKNTIEAGGKTYIGKHIIIATGGTPFMPEFEGSEHAITSDGIWDLTELPQKMLIVGGGYIGLEFASIFNSLGSEVHVAIRSGKILNGFDADIQQNVREELEKRGIAFHPMCEVCSIEKDASGQLHTSLNTGENLSVNCVVIAAGRIPNTKHLNIEKSGISLGERGEVEVNKRLLTSENVYAIGDITNRLNLTPIAIKDGRMVADNLFAGKDFVSDDGLVVSAVFSSPPIGTIGLTEATAQEKFGAENVFTISEKFKPMAYALTDRDEKCFIKLIFKAENEQVIGAHMVGRDAPEIMQMLAIAVRMGATLEDLNKTLAIHPTTGEEIVLMRRTK